MIEIRPCAGFDELQACVDLQIATWGYDATDVVPRKIFRVAEHIGGQVIGAFDTERAASLDTPAAGSLVGFAMAWTGAKSGDRTHPARPYLHSHMLAVLPEYRNQGLGARLKWFQREDALNRGIGHMEWTFDPVEIKNAYLNLAKLGAVVCHYEVNFYGSSSSPLQGGLPTDRFVAEWRMDSPRVAAAREGRLADYRQTEGKIEIECRITVPAEIYAWKDSPDTRDRALELHRANREAFLDAFARGLAVVGYSRDTHGNGYFELGSRARLEETLKRR